MAPSVPARLALLTSVAAALVASTAAPAAHAATLFQCAASDGAPLFSDLPCPDGTGPRGQRVIEHPVAGNFIDGGLTAADEAHLRQIDQRRHGRGGGISGLADPADVARCARARERLDAHREKARRPHATPMLNRGRELRRAVHEACR